MKRNGFTLVELLVVIAIMGILATFVVGAAGYASRVSREKRKDISCHSLEVAIARYRTEYNEWPGGYNGSGASHVFERAKNADVFGMLRIDDDKNNPDKIRFLDETAFFTTTPGGKELRKLSETTGAQPLACLARNGRDVVYFRVEINYQNETVKVTVPNFGSGDDEDN